MFDLEDIAGLHIESGFDKQYTYEGKAVPRVTAVISKMIEEKGLIQWANTLGFQHTSYSKMLKELATLGTLTHNAIEIFLNGGEIPDETPQFPMDSFRLWWMEMEKMGAIVIGTENALVCDLYGGTYDLLMEVDGRIILVDFKTSNHVTYKYWLQLAAYNRVLRSMGMKIDGCLILQLSKFRVAFREYFLDLRWKPHRQYFDICERTFLSLLYGYYHITYLERRFKYEWPIIDPKYLSREDRPSGTGWFSGQNNK